MIITKKLIEKLDKNQSINIDDWYKIQAFKIRLGISKDRIELKQTTLIEINI